MVGLSGASKWLAPLAQNTRICRFPPRGRPSRIQPNRFRRFIAPVRLQVGDVPLRRAWVPAGLSRDLADGFDD